MTEKKDSKKRCPSGSFAYTIKSGDTLYLLAQRYNTTVEAIMKINPGINPQNLKIGEVICIPGAETPTPPCPNGFLYTIKSGDTFYKLAQQFNTTVEALMRANPGVNPDNLQIGQVICIPQMSPPGPPTPSCPNGFLYTVKSGDTFYKLAQQFNTTVDALMRANPGVDPNNLRVGQVICIPQMSPPGPPTPSCPNGFLYTVKAGDTFYTLSQQFNVSIEELMRANPGVNPDRLQIGQVICIPQIAPPPMPPCPNGFYYTVRPGDTLYTIGQYFNVPVQSIMTANPGIDPNNLRPGQIICIPRKCVVHCY